jgi:hypothetical protein
MPKKISGTLEWAPVSKNIQMGCDNGEKGGCLYCYARARALRFKQIPNSEAWGCPVINQRMLNERPKKLEGRIFFPSAHDITPRNIDIVVPYLKRWLSVGNEFLIVSKPNIACVRRLCEELVDYKDRVMFRFTIGSTNDDVLAFWEPGVSKFAEREECLQAAFYAGYKTSVSSEPYLDATILDMVPKLAPFVTSTHWLGLMNSIKVRVRRDGWGPKEYARLLGVTSVQDEVSVRMIYEALRDSCKVRFKESMKKVLGLPLATEAGLDI